MKKTHYVQLLFMACLIVVIALEGTNIISERMEYIVVAILLAVYIISFAVYGFTKKRKKINRK